MLYYDNKTFTDVEFSRYITKKYVYEHFEHPKKVMERYTLKQVARLLGEIDVSFFALYYMRNKFVVSDDNAARELSKAHYDIWNVLNDTFVEDIMDKVNLVEPRGFAKTTVGNLLLSIWLVCYKKSIFTLIGAKADKDAEQFLTSIKMEMQNNEIIKEEFGILIDPKKNKPGSTEKYKINSGEIEFTNGTYIRVISSGSSARGANWGGVRPTVFIGDDYQSEADTLTEDAREKKWNRWCKEIEEVGDTAVYRNGKKIKSATKFINCGTVLHVDCMISKLCRNKEYYTIKNSAILLEEGQTVEDIFESKLWTQCKRLYFDDKLENPKMEAEKFYREHEKEMKYPLLWEEKWDFFNDIAVKYWENRISFMSEKMNDAQSIGERWFKSIRTQSKEEIEDHVFTKTALVIDPASTKSKKSDNTAMIIGSLAKNDFKYCRKLIRDKFSFDEYCERVIELLLEYEDITHIVIEKNTYQGADVVEIKRLIALEPRLRHRRFTFINNASYKNKDERISTIIDEVNNGQIIFVDDNPEFTDELLDFQGQQYSTKDDCPDVTAEFSRIISTINPVVRVRVIDKSPLGI